MRGSLSGGFLRTTGGTLTGPLTISANVDGLLVLNRPDGADHAALVAQMAGADVWELEHRAAEPKLRIADTTAAKSITLNTATGAVALVGQLAITANAAPLLIFNRPDGASAQLIVSRLAGADRWRMLSMSTEPGYRLTDGGGTDRLSARIDTGLLGGSLIPLSMLRRDEASGENAGGVTLLATNTALVDVATAVDVAIGDRITVYAKVGATKGAVSGTTAISIVKQAGTATGVWTFDEGSMPDERSVVALEFAAFSIAGVFRVTGAGTLTLRLQGRSAGSNSDVGAGDADLYLLTLRDGP
jgi:hypothetical protein